MLASVACSVAAVAVPAASPQLTVGIDFPQHPWIGRQWASWAPAEDPFATAVAPARTFALAEDLEAMRRRRCVEAMQEAGAQHERRAYGSGALGPDETALTPGRLSRSPASGSSTERSSLISTFSHGLAPSTRFSQIRVVERKVGGITG